MPLTERQAEVVWEGNLTQGRGRIVSVGSGAFGDLPITWSARTESPDDMTSPEELIAAAHAACYAMALSDTLAEKGMPPERLAITAVCALEKTKTGIKVASVDLDVTGRVPGLEQEEFEQAAQEGDQGCPVSNALRNNVEIRVKARLES